MEKLDIYVREDLNEVVQRVDKRFGLGPSQDGIRVIAVGFAKNYKNWFCAVPPGFTEGFKPGLEDMDGVFINEYPPEIQADMDEHG